jgi:hypothetical protein
MREIQGKLGAEVAGSHKEEVLDILEAEADGNHKAEAKGFEEIGSTSSEDKVQIGILLCLLYPIS